MLRKYRIILLLNCLSLFFLLHSCNQISEDNISRITIPNDSIVGQAFLGSNNSTVEYSPKGNFIKIPIDYNNVWHNVELYRFNNKINSKELIIFDTIPKHSLIFDSLDFGKYKLNFISILEDTVVRKINFKNNTELHKPNSLDKFYKEKNIVDFPEINKINSSDTLQIYNTNFGCFGGSVVLYEFFRNSNNEFIYRKKIKGGGYDYEPQNEWIYKNNDVTEELMMFVEYLKEIDEKHKTPCPSGNIEFKLRLKRANVVFNAKDYYCSPKRVYINDVLK